MVLVFSTVIATKGIPKGRPRLGRGGHVFTPKRTRDFENLIRSQLAREFRHRPLVGAVRLNVEFYFKRPKKPVHAYPSVSDCDNLAKAVSDAANKILFEDDSQVTQLSVSKSYADYDSIHVSLWTIS